MFEGEEVFNVEDGFDEDIWDEIMRERMKLAGLIRFNY